VGWQIFLSHATMDDMNMTPLEQRFWAKVNKTDTCWLWTAGLSAYRYGNFSTPEHPKGVKAHRFSWELHYGSIPEGLFVLHKCDVGICVRPDHLFLGTQADNVHDCEEKGRAYHRRGQDNGRAILSEEEVLEIKSKLTGEWGEIAELAREYEVNYQIIYQIKTGRTWGWLDKE
jgi:hypothetical protein